MAQASLAPHVGAGLAGERWELTQGSRPRGPRDHHSPTDPVPGLVSVLGRVPAVRFRVGLSCLGLLVTRLAVAKPGGFLGPAGERCNVLMSI